ncbi:Hypothetical protein R9X50_00262000 [Acrodontium crateriforme]|uniref:DUF4604 domain-containing protein n=1 Tax=Acrodontium crateriforme TaxID=150365 RepID=A0AAQ3M190_9PEZI|nr:Hypothetical protein R9X50_00262000 [Acrodontium crateriforme]
MSGKIKGKDLVYDKSLPSFLQRLHAAKGANGDADRHERQIARPTKARDVNEDDGPTIVDETGETVTKDELEKMAADDGTKDETQAGEVESAGLKRPEKDVMIAVGATKKRKAAKVIGDDDEPSANSTAVPSEESTKSVKKPKKKTKAIKLAFDDDDEAT